MIFKHILKWNKQFVNYSLLNTKSVATAVDFVGKRLGIRAAKTDKDIKKERSPPKRAVGQGYNESEIKRKRDLHLNGLSARDIMNERY